MCKTNFQEKVIKDAFGVVIKDWDIVKVRKSAATPDMPESRIGLVVFNLVHFALLKLKNPKYFTVIDGFSMKPEDGYKYKVIGDLVHDGERMVKGELP